MPSIAVVIPTHNRTTPLVRAVRSVLSQTLRPAELIVVDDGSTPPAGGCLADFPEVRVIVNPRRMGAASSRNRGVQAASSELIAFLDSDDYWADIKLEAQHAVFVERPDVDLV
ncbi:MAG: glycosyltransferase family 2 protein, partial [Geminicoccales bacterium]